MRLFHHRGFSGAVLADLLTILGLSGLVFFLSQFLQLVQGRGPLEAGLAELPAAVGAVVAGLIAGRAARRFSVRSVVTGGLGAIGLALAAVTLIHRETAYPLIGAVLLIVGVGAGFAFTVTSDVILSSVPKEQAGSAGAVSETAYELGAALGIALLGSIVTGVYQTFDTPHGVPSAPPPRPMNHWAAPSRRPTVCRPSRDTPWSPRRRTPSSKGCGSPRGSARRSCWRRPSPPGSCCAVRSWRTASCTSSRPGHPDARKGPYHREPGYGPFRMSCDRRCGRDQRVAPRLTRPWPSWRTCRRTPDPTAA